MSIDAHKNFAYSTIAVAPTPAASGTTFSVQTGDGTLFPAVSFNAVVWPAGASPLSTNAEVVRVTSKGTGDNWTVTRVTESSSARSIAVGDQIAAAITSKTLKDVEEGLGVNPGGRLTLTSGTTVTTADVAAATTIYYAPHISDSISLFDGTDWRPFTFTELSIAVPATTATMYDVFAYSNAGVVTLELLAWTNTTTRATALTRLNGRLVKSGTTTRRYIGSVCTAAVSGQTEDSYAKRYLYNYYNRVQRPLRKLEATDTWTYSTASFRQVNASTANQVEIVNGWLEDAIDVWVTGLSTTSAGTAGRGVSIGENSTTVGATGVIGPQAGVGSATYPAGQFASHFAQLRTCPAVGLTAYVWLESGGTNVAFYGDNGGASFYQSGISGLWRG